MPPLEPSYREIPLTHGQVAIVDTADYEELSKEQWYAKLDKKNNCFYAASRRGKSRVFMHRKILGFANGDPRQGDHRLHNTLDNRRFVNGEVNLRIASRSENLCNRGVQSNNQSGYKNVRWDKRDRKWYVRVYRLGKVYGPYLFKHLPDALQAAVLVRFLVHGEFSYS